MKRKRLLLFGEPKPKEGTIKMFKDRRLFEREPINVEIEPNEKLPGKVYLLRDISKGGFKLQTDQFMAEGDHFDSSFSLPDGITKLRLCGRVVWVKKISSNPEIYYISFAFQTCLNKLPSELFSIPLTNPEKISLG